MWWLAARPLLRGLPVPLRYRHTPRGKTVPESLPAWLERCRNIASPLAQDAATHWSDAQLETAYKELQWFHRTIGYKHYPVINLFERFDPVNCWGKAKAKAKGKKASMRGAGAASTA